jgi:hypothetical protein
MAISCSIAIHGAQEFTHMKTLYAPRITNFDQRTTRPALMHFLVFILFFYVSAAMAIEEPKYEVVFSEGDFEIRQYQPMLIAQTEVEGDIDQASNKGFRLIADFIFGNNQAVNSEKTSKIAMTAPVTVEPQSVQADILTAQKWRIHFVMPSQYSLATIPKPNNSVVELKEIPSKFFVVHKYSGLNTLSRVQAKTLEAINWVQQRSLKVVGAPRLSRYDPPWTLPMFRRNEIMIEITNY